MQQLSKSDIASAQQLVSREMHRVGPDMLIDQEAIDRFASATLDFNPRHVDPVKKQAGKTVAHGLMGACLVPALSSDLEPFTLFKDAKCMLMEVQNISFGRPIRVGTIVRCYARIPSIVVEGKGLKVVYEWQILSGVDEAAVTSHTEGTFLLLYR